MIKFTIFVNQRAVIENGFDLDFNDMAIFDLMKDAANGPRIKKMLFNNSTFYEFRWKWIISQLPMLKIKTRQGINKRLQKLIDCEIIVGYPFNSAENTAFYSFGPKYDLMIYSNSDGVNENLQGVNENLQGVNENLQGCKQKFTGGVNENLHNKKVNNKKVITSKKIEPSKRRFTPPTVNEVSEYCKIRGNNVDSVRFVAFYASKGWKVGDQPMVDWKQAVITWEVRNKKESKQPNLFSQRNTVSNYSLKDEPTEERF